MANNNNGKEQTDPFHETKEMMKQMRINQTEDNKQIHELTIHVASLRELNQTKMDEIMNLHDQLADKEHAIAKQEALIKELKEQNMSRWLKNKETFVDAYEQNRESLYHQIAELETQCAKYKQQIFNLNRSNADLRQWIDGDIQDMDAKDKMIHSLEHKIRKSEHSLIEFQKKKQHDIASLNVLDDGYIEIINELKQELAACQQQNNALLQTNDDLQRQNKQMTETTHELRLSLLTNEDDDGIEDKDLLIAQQQLQINQCEDEINDERIF